MIRTPLTPIDPSVAADPRLINVAVTVAAVVVIATAFPRVVGPLQKTWEAWTLSARRAQADERASDVAELRSEVANLRTLLRDYRTDLDDLRRHQTAHTDVLSAHASYDQAMIALVVSLGGTPLPYRALWPTCPSSDPQEQPDPPNDGGYAADLTHP